MPGGMQYQVRGLPALVAMWATRDKRKIEAEKQSLQDQVQNWEKTLGMLKTHSPDDERIPLLVDKIAEARIGNLGLSQGQGQRPGPAPTQRTPQPEEFIPRSASPVRVGGAFKGPAQFQGRERAAHAKHAGKTLVARQKAAAQAAEPSQGLRDRYKSVGTQMVKKAEKIAGLRILVQKLDTGILGIGSNERQVRLDQRNVAIAEEEMAPLQKKYDDLKVFARKNGKTLEPNEWDIDRASNLPAGGNLATSPQLGPAFQGGTGDVVDSLGTLSPGLQGGAQPLNTWENPARPTTRAEYDALPNDAWYIHPQKGLGQKGASSVRRAGL